MEIGTPMQIMGVGIITYQQMISSFGDNPNHSNTPNQIMVRNIISINVSGTLTTDGIQMITMGQNFIIARPSIVYPFVIVYWSELEVMKFLMEDFIYNRMEVVDIPLKYIHIIK
jgi:hypothetical protein